WHVITSSNSNSTYNVADNQAGVSDVQKRWAQRFVELAAAKGLVEGVVGGRYTPDKNVTRAEFAAMLVRALGQGAVTEATTGVTTGETTSATIGETTGTATVGKTPPYAYNDVAPNAWYYGAVSAAKELGLLSFVQHSNDFKPDQP